VYSSNPLNVKACCMFPAQAFQSPVKVSKYLLQLWLGGLQSRSGHRGQQKIRTYV